MSNTAQLLKQRLATIQKLQKLKQKVDPASGMTITVRRGALAEEQPQEEISLETCENMVEVLDLLIHTQVKSLHFWQKTAANDIADIQKALEETKNAGY